MPEKVRADLQEFLADASPPGEVRRLMETARGYDPVVWARMAEQFGLQGLLVPTRLGGSGGGWPELAVALQEMGRALLCAPFLSTAVLATTAILQAGDARAEDEVLASIASGRMTATVASSEDDGRWDTEAVTTVASRSGDGYVLDGHKAFVLDGHVADILVVVARTAAGLSLFLVAADAPGLVRSLSPTMDLTRKLARLELSSTPARLLGTEGGAGAVLQRVLDLGAVALAAEQVGGAERCLEMAVDHARARVQFGRPIGSFQAIKHRCADMLVRVQCARAAADNAARAAEGGGADLPIAASVAKAFCSDAYFDVAASNIQVHGARGFSWDHDPHLWFKRATSSKLLFGDPAYHRRLLARRLRL